MVLEGAKCLNTKRCMFHLSNETPIKTPTSLTRIMFKSANMITNNNCQNIQENTMSFGPTEQIISNIVQTSTKVELATYHYQSLGPPQYHQY